MLFAIKTVREPSGDVASATSIPPATCATAILHQDCITLQGGLYYTYAGPPCIAENTPRPPAEELQEAAHVPWYLDSICSWQENWKAAAIHKHVDQWTHHQISKKLTA